MTTLQFLPILSTFNASSSQQVTSTAEVFDNTTSPLRPPHRNPTNANFSPWALEEYPKDPFQDFFNLTLKVEGSGYREEKIGNKLTYSKYGITPDFIDTVIKRKNPEEEIKLETYYKNRELYT